MAVTDQTPLNTYTGNGVTTVFAYSFLVLLAGDLSAKVGGTVKTQGVDFTVSGAGVSSGGSVTFTTAPASGVRVELYRDTALARVTDYQDNGDLLADTVNLDFDRIWLAMQERNRDVSSTVRAPVGETLAEMPAAATRASRLLAFDAAGAPEESPFTTTQVASAIAAAYTGMGTADAAAFIAAGTGAIPRTLQTKVREVSVSIADYTGADPTGATSSVGAMRLAEAALPNGGTIDIPPGTWMFDDDYELTTNGITIRGTRGVSIIKQSGNKVALYIQSSDVEVTGIRFVGDQSGGAASRTNLLIIGGPGKTPARVSVHHNDFVNASSTCILYGGDLATCSDIYIDHNTMTDFWECGTDCVTAGQSRIWITDNIMRSSVVHPNAAVSRPIGVAMEPASAGTTSDYFVINNFVDFSAISVPNRNVTHGIRVGQPSVPPANFVLKRAIFEGNTLRGVGQGIQLSKARWGTTTESATVTIADNIIESTRDRGMTLIGGEDGTYADTITITGNTIKGFSEATTNGYDAIFLDGYWNRPLVSGNIITARNGETGATNGRYGVNFSVATITAPRVGTDNVIQSCTSGRVNDATASATHGLLGAAAHFYTPGLLSISGNVSYTPDTGSLLFYSPLTADRSIIPSTSTINAFANGHLVLLANTGTTGFHLVFDPVGINVKVGNGASALFAYDLANATWRQVRMGAVAQQRETAANIISAAATINTVDKFDGKQVYDTTNKRILVAQGALAASTWVVVDGATTITPV
jgi:hypothetical protein